MTGIKSMYMIRTNTIFFLPNIFDPRLVESRDAEPTDRMGQLYESQRGPSSISLNLSSSFLFLWDWGLNSGLCTCKSGTLPLELLLLEPLHQPFFVMVFLR
jgi:hypothetical protein